MMEKLNLSISMIFMLVLMLVSMAFFTLLEQKVLSHIQIRKGPLYTGYMGLLQPFSDAVKLLNKQNILTLNMNKNFFILSPIFSLIFSLMMWFSNSNFNSSMILNFSIFYFFFFSSLAVLPILIMGWSSNCKYSMLGSLRSVSQMVSYEAVMTLLILSLIWMSNSMSFKIIMNMKMMSLLFYGPFCMIWMCVMLSETNRTPYDFSEGGSELVSGFITEYGSFGFTLVFMSEYMSILFMSLLFVLMLSTSNFFMVGFYLILVGYLFIWIRSSLPRFRYDKLMHLVWKCFLPLSVYFFIFFFNLDFVKILL